MRLFVAFKVPDAQMDSLETAVAGLKAAVGQARWVPRENRHVTLKFLGQVPEERLGEVEAVVASCVSECGPITTGLTGIGAFPSLRRPRVLWAGLSDDLGELGSLAAALEERFAGAGFPGPPRTLHPHLTVARARNGPLPSGLIEGNGPYLLDETRFQVREVIVFRSILGRTGARYEQVRRFSLGA